MSINPFERLNWINICKETAACRVLLSAISDAKWRCHLVHFVPDINIWDFNPNLWLSAVWRSSLSQVTWGAWRKQHLEVSEQMCGGLLHLVKCRMIRCESDLKAEPLLLFIYVNLLISSSPESIFILLLVSHSVFTEVLHFESGPKTLFTPLFYWEMTLLRLPMRVRPHI